MNKAIITAVSALAIFAAVPAMAEMKAQVKTSAEASKTGDIAADAKEAWKDIKKDANEAYEDIMAVFVEDGNKPVTFNTRHTATGMIGSPVVNAKQERVGTVKDIIVDKDGNASMLIIADGEFPGFDGKLVAFDYNVISRLNADGDVIAPISEENLSKAAEFSYDRNAKADGKVRLISGQAYSVEKLLEGQLLNPKHEDVAQIDDVMFKNGKATNLIVSFDKVLGLGGKKVAMNYDAAKIVRKSDEIDFQLNQKQTAQFEVYKKTASN